jgi:3-hydroxybutyryl-CoA dehydrogenase
VGEIRRVGVVGSGLMGSGIAEVCARAGLDVLVGEVSEDAAPPLLLRMVDSGPLGQKTDRGFYDYTDSARGE